MKLNLALAGFGNVGHGLTSASDAVTDTAPVEVPANPTEPPPLLNVAPSSIKRVPVDWPPTTRLPEFDQLVPAPVTVTVPKPPGKLPIVLLPNMANVPGDWMTSTPCPSGPTSSA